MTRPLVAVDLDGLLGKQIHGQWRGCEEFPEPIDGAVDFTKQLAEFADVVIHTCRTNPEITRGVSPMLMATLIRQWLDKHGFAYHEIWTGRGKPVARAYVDDRAVECQPQVHGIGEFEMALGMVRDLCELPASPVTEEEGGPDGGL